MNALHDGWRRAQCDCCLCSGAACQSPEGLAAVVDMSATADINMVMNTVQPMVSPFSEQLHVRKRQAFALYCVPRGLLCVAVPRGLPQHCHTAELLPVLLRICAPQARLMLTLGINVWWLQPI